MSDASNTPTSPSCPTCTFLALHLKDPAKKRTPRVEELLRQNHPPLDVELADFRLVLDKSPEILQDLDAKIAQATETLNHLKEARMAAESHLEDAKALIHPIRSIPNEVLAEIFMHSIPSWETGGVVVDSLNPNTPPWTLTHVCRRWRELAISLPQIWAYIYLDFDRHAKHITPRQCAYKTGLYLGRSRDFSLSVVLHSRADAITNCVIPMLELTVPRWKRLSARISQSSLHSFSGHIFSRLEILMLDHVKRGQRNGEVTTLKSTPALQTLYPHSSWDVFKKVPVPWAQLTKTTLRFPAFDETGLDCLRKMSSLQHLEVDIGETYNDIKDVIVLPKLQRLGVNESSEADSGCLKKFFSRLEVPALSNLALDFPDVERVMYLPRSIGAVDKLTKLDISCEMSNHNKNTQNLLKFLSLLSHVEEFRLRDFGVTQQFISGLTVSATAWRLPCLRILNLQDTHCEASLAVSLPAIFDMLESRYNVVSEDSAEGEGSQTVGVARPSMTFFLEKVSAPRWLYFRKEERWKDICNALHVECGVLLSDMDEDEDEEENSDSDEEEEEEEEMVSEATS